MRKLTILVSLFILFISILACASYVVVVRTEPFANVYVNGIYAGISDINGFLQITLSSSGEHRITVSKSWYLVFDGLVYVSQPGQVVVYAPLSRAGSLRVYSNVYPVEVYSENRFLGKVNSVKDTVYVPEGSVYITFKASGYIPETRLLNISYLKETSVNINLIEEVLSVSLKVEPKEFSPNGDWYNDTTTFYVYLSKPAQLTINIVDINQNTVWQWSGKGKPGSNQISWDGKDIPDGDYTVKAIAQTEKESFIATDSVRIDRSHYTNTKEIILTTTFIAVGALVFMFLISSGL
ncbi:MAG TPA: hypothetical protein VIL29_09215 [Pseudothermotoga sp.]|uniref:hypothetical protein n=1 Tax=Thermotoga profunda TaxID=1508420 RepID=UPI0005977939|nr:hypothetical protein [Thermotoga profunda]